MPVADGPENHRAFLIENINGLNPNYFFMFLDIAGSGAQKVTLRDVESIDVLLSVNPSGIVSTLDGMSHASKYHGYYYALGEKPQARLEAALSIYNQDSPAVLEQVEI